MLSGEISVPGDKSISHRAVILGALAQGETVIHGFLESQDCLSTLHILRQCGVKITQHQDKIIIQGHGLHSLTSPLGPLNCNNSGTSMRLLAGVLAGQPFESTLVGDNSLQKRPMERIVTPLKKMGANIEGNYQQGEIFPPLHIHGKAQLQSIQYAMPIASAQVKSCLLFAGLYASTPTVIVENTPTRDHTERMLKRFGADIKIDHHKVTLNPHNPLIGQTISIPGDISSAAFFISAAAMTPGSHLIIKNVGVNPTRTGIIDILRNMGANIQVHLKEDMGSEPSADIEVKGNSLHGITVSHESVARAIDEFPIIFIAAACSKGQTIIRGIQELRFKETDRIQTMATGLLTLGISVAVLRDGIIIEGGTMQGGTVDSAGDHRVAMAFAMAGLVAKAPIRVLHSTNIVTSFPSFSQTAKSLGLALFLED